MINYITLYWLKWYKYVLDGTNLGDLSDFRTGLKALKESNIISLLKECRLTREEIRYLSKN